MHRRHSPNAIVLDFGHMGGSWELENAGSIGDLTRFVLEHKYLERDYFILAQDYSYFHILDHFTIHTMHNLRLINATPRLGLVLDAAKQMLVEQQRDLNATLICHQAVLTSAIRVGSRYGLTLTPPQDPLPADFHPGCHHWVHRHAYHWRIYRYFRRDVNLLL